MKENTQVLKTTTYGNLNSKAEIDAVYEDICKQFGDSKIDIIVRTAVEIDSNEDVGIPLSQFWGQNSNPEAYIEFTRLGGGEKDTFTINNDRVTINSCDVKGYEHEHEHVNESHSFTAETDKSKVQLIVISKNTVDSSIKTLALEIYDLTEIERNKLLSCNGKVYDGTNYNWINDIMRYILLHPYSIIENVDCFAGADTAIVIAYDVM